MIVKAFQKRPDNKQILMCHVRESAHFENIIPSIAIRVRIFMYFRLSENYRY